MDKVCRLLPLAGHTIPESDRRIRLQPPQSRAIQHLVLEAELPSKSGMSRLLRDFRYAARTLARNPGFATTAIAALALGIGATTAIFSVVNKVLLEPLPFPDAGRLVQLMTVSQLGNQSVVSIPKYVIWRDNTHVFDSIAAYDISGLSISLNHGDFAEPLEAARVSANYFSLFGARVTIGRAFSTSEDQPGGPRVCVISESLWRARFAGDPALIGRTCRPRTRGRSPQVGSPAKGSAKRCGRDHAALSPQVSSTYSIGSAHAPVRRLYGHLPARCRGRRHSAGIVPADRRRRFCAPHFLCQRRQPPAGAHFSPDTGTRS